MASPDDDLFFDRLEDAAKWFGKPHNTLQTSWRPSGMPGDKGLWSARSIGRWLAEQYGSKKANSVEADAKREAETRKLIADADMKEFDLLVKKGGLRKVEAVRLRFGEVATKCRDRLMRIATTLKPMLPEEYREQIAAEVDQQVRLALTALVEDLKRVAEEPEDEEATDGEE